MAIQIWPLVSYLRRRMTSDVCIVGERGPHGSWTAIFGVLSCRKAAEEFCERIGRGEVREALTEFPVVILQWGETGPSRYDLVGAYDDLDAVSRRTAPGPAEQDIRFNVFVVRKDTVNASFPGEPCLGGRTEHYHVRNADLRGGAVAFLAQAKVCLPR
ncbi:MAG: hypothetical protein M9894_24380 [Planctomycetes bacterium]|nr:hypothetical protein [Planctomycetota bacterium]